MLSVLKVLRILRVLRPLRAINRAKGLKVPYHFFYKLSSHYSSNPSSYFKACCQLPCGCA
jgi:hypothetical protein